MMPLKLSSDFLGRVLRTTPSCGRKVVYTCLFGHSEFWNDFHYERPAGVDFVCFTDDPAIRSDFWEIRLMPRSGLDPHRYSKRFKHLPHTHFPRHDVSLYVDNVVRLLAPVNEIFSLFEKAEAPIAMFRHPFRDCVYEEAAVVIANRIDNADRVRAQMEIYRRFGHPEQAGLHATTMMVRRHHEKHLSRMSELWHEQVRCHSKRDQLSFDVLRLRHGLKVAALPGSLDRNALMRWPAIRNGVRLPRNFDETRYLALYPDVAAAKIDPRFHYLHHGLPEGRRHE